MNTFFHRSKRKLKGFGLLESLLSISVLALITTIVANLLIDVNRSNIGSQHSLKAHRVMIEANEAVRSIRDQNFLYLTNGTHGLLNTNGVWSLAGSEEVVDDLYTRRVIIEDVYRNNSGDIHSAGTELDERIKRVTIQVEWESTVEGTKSIETELLISDWEAQETVRSNDSEWSNGTHTQTTTDGSGDGALVLDSYIGSWENAFTDASYIFSNNANGNAIKVRNNIGYLVANYNGQVNNFTIIDVSDPSNIIVLGSVGLSDNANDIAIGPNHAYIATSNQTKELITVDISNPASPSIVQEQDLAGTKNAISAFVDGDILHVGAERNTNTEWHIFNLQNPATPTLITSTEMNASIYEIEVVNKVAYLAASGIDSLQVYDVNDPGNIVPLGSLSVTPENTGRGLDFNDNKIYFSSAKSTSTGEFHIIDVSTPSSPTILSNLELNTDLFDVEVYGTDAFITTTKTSEQFQVIDASDTNNPLHDTSLDLGANGNKIFANQNAIYVTSDDNSSALYILSQPVEEYYGSGNFLSAAFDSGSDSTQWLTFNWEGVIGPNTSVQFQLRFADTEANLNAATWSGPDGSSSSYYVDQSNVITVPGTVSGTRWMQYRVDLSSSDGEYTPEVYSVRIQYAP